MSLYTDIYDAVIAWTNKPKMVTETNIAIKQALRTAHKAGGFYRDLVEVSLTGQATDALQTIDLSLAAPNYRQLAYVKPTGVELQYDPIEITDLFDADRRYRHDVYYGIGTNLMIRAASPSSDLTICYYRYPTVNPIESIDSWIADLHQDLVVLWSSATVLALVGEQEIKSRVDQLAKLAYNDLIEDSTTLVRR